LTAIELKNRLQTNLKCVLPATVAFDYPTVEKLVGYLGQKILQLSSDSVVKNAINTEVTLKPVTELSTELSEDKIADLLAQELLEIEQERY
jgi:Cu/Ag efflux pump CusA